MPHAPCHIRAKTLKPGKTGSERKKKKNCNQKNCERNMIWIWKHICVYIYIHIYIFKRISGLKQNNLNWNEPSLLLIFMLKIFSFFIYIIQEQNLNFQCQIVSFQPCQICWPLPDSIHNHCIEVITEIWKEDRYLCKLNRKWLHGWFLNLVSSASNSNALGLPTHQKRMLWDGSQSVPQSQSICFWPFGKLYFSYK